MSDTQKELVDLITREVMETYRREQGGGAWSSSPPPPTPRMSPPKPLSLGAGSRPLIVVTGNARGKDMTVSLFERLRKAYPDLSVLLSHPAQKLFGGSRRTFGGFALDPGTRDHQEVLGRFTHLVALNSSVNFVTKIALLLADTPVTAAVFEMLAQGKPVHVVRDPLVPWFFTPAVEERVSSYLDCLSSYGVNVISADDLLGALPKRASGPEPFLSAAPIASGSSGSSRGSRPRAASGTGEGPPPGLLPSDCSGCQVAGWCATYCPDRLEQAVAAGATRLSSVPGKGGSVRGQMAGMIDHTLLKADARDEEIEKLCQEARKYQFASVCVNPSRVRLAADLLRGSPVKVCTVIGFPLGATTTRAKVCETRDAIADGADEIDMVINIGALKAGDHDLVREDIREVVAAAGPRVTKVILETALLTDYEKRVACRLAKQAGATFVKTSTGFSKAGATVADVELMRQEVGPAMGVKASGGIRDYETARKMVAAGATRLGCSAGVAIVTGEGGGGRGY